MQIFVKTNRINYYFECIVLKTLTLRYLTNKVYHLIYKDCFFWENYWNMVKLYEITISKKNQLFI